MASRSAATAAATGIDVDDNNAPEDPQQQRSSFVRLVVDVLEEAQVLVLPRGRPIVVSSPGGPANHKNKDDPLLDGSAQQKQQQEQEEEEEDVYRRFETWIGLRDDDDDNDVLPTLEDACPISDSLLGKLVLLLEFAWNGGGGNEGDGDDANANKKAAAAAAASQRSALLLEATATNGGGRGREVRPTATSSSSSSNTVNVATEGGGEVPHRYGGAPTTNAFEACRSTQKLRTGDSSASGPVVVTWTDAVPAVRATTWFRHMLDLTVRPDATLAQLVLQGPFNSQEGGGGRSLLRSLYHHVRDLPRLQGHMHAYAVQLQLASGSVTSASAPVTRQVSDPKARLAQYEAAQQVSQQLQRVWDEHLRRVQIVMGELYCDASAELRAYQRQCLGKVWDDFLQKANAVPTRSTPSTSFAISARNRSHENTSAAAIPLTLSLLHRILLGGGISIAATTTTATTRTAAESASGAGGVVPPTPTPPSLPESYLHLLTHVLVPLHKTNQLVLWRDQMPVLQLYHERLTQCVAVILAVDPIRLIPAVVELICTDADIFPVAGNTPKQVLLLHEIDSYLGLALTKGRGHVLDGWTRVSVPSLRGPPSMSSPSPAWFRSLLLVLGRCMGSEHSRVAERALEYFQNRAFVRLVDAHLDESLTCLLPHLVKKEPSWNPTVRKRTHVVLTKLQGMDSSAFERVSNRLFGGDTIPPSADSTGGAPAGSSPSLLLSTLRHSSAHVVPKDLSLKSGMGSWRPPTTTKGFGGAPTAASSAGRQRLPIPIPIPPRTSSSHVAAVGESDDIEQRSMPPPLPPSGPIPSRAQPPPPPSTVTGVLPWAMTRTPPATARVGRHGARQAPPATVTGVAPWAVAPPLAAVRSSGPPATVTGVAPWAAVGSAPGPHSATSPKRRALDADGDPSSTAACPEPAGASSAGLARVVAYMKLIEPPDSGGDGVSTWNKSQMSETPTLLPDLKFHDLVFGHDLGAGAFGCVRYARLIDRSKTRSYWAEYAVKIIATDKIRELGYEASVQREIAVLRILSHPGIARLVSSFRFRDGAYLVLEYASGGDLHQLLRKHGSLDHESTRFVMGEAVAALSSIHDLGFVYSDLKAENILITETGHIKLTDMGACRPVTREAKEAVRTIAKDLLKNLRDGDWKPQRRPGMDPNDGCEAEAEDEEDDTRIEGTISYLPPEVVLGGIPTVAADSWALGCVTYQCLSGRPPFLEIDEEATRQRIVSFQSSTSESVSTTPPPSLDPLSSLFLERHASSIEPSARDLICSLLQRHPVHRPSMPQVAAHPYFTDSGVDVFSLHRQPAYKLDVGTVAPSPDAQWSRRQYSSIWAPQPAAYDLSLPDSGSAPSGDAVSFGSSLSAPIPEGEERSALFAWTKSTSVVRFGSAPVRRQLVPIKEADAASRFE